MVEASGAQVTAHAPTVVAANDVGALQAALAQAILAQEEQRAETEGARNIASLETSIEKLKAHLTDLQGRLDVARKAEAERLQAKAAEEERLAAEATADSEQAAPAEGN